MPDNINIPPPGASLAMQGHVRWWVIDKDDKVVKEGPGWQPNIILNDGMNTIGGSFGGPRHICDCFLYAQASIGAAATSINGGGDTIQQAGQIVTRASGSFDFVAQGLITGDSVKFGTGGADVMVVSVDSTTQLTVNVSQTVAPTTFQVFKTSQTSAAFNAGGEERTNTYISGPGLCGSTLSGSTFSHIRTFDFAVRASPKTYTELGMGWSPTPSAPNTTFARMLVSGGSVLVNIGERLRVAYRLSVYVSSTGGVAKSMGVVGWPISPATDTTGTEKLQLPGISTVDLFGATAINSNPISPAVADAATCNEPAGTSVAFLSTSSTAPTAFNNDAPARGSIAAITMPIVPSYATNTFYIIKQAIFTPGIGTSTGIRSIGIGTNVNSRVPSGPSTGYVFVLTLAQTKTAGNTLTLNFRYSWSRVLA